MTDYLVYWAAAKPETPAITFTDHSVDRAGISRTVTYAELDGWTGAVAEEIARLVRPGGRAAVLCPQGIEYVVAFLAALRAGVVCVPLFPPELPGHRDRLLAALTDCRPDCVVATTRTTGVQAGELPHDAAVVFVSRRSVWFEWCSTSFAISRSN
ncbi:MAG: AMP-binding protein [Baekduiaceae bacterium]